VRESMLEKTREASAERPISGARLPPGERLDDRFVIQRFIAEGATSRVYAARDVARAKWVALKVARNDLGDEALGRFRVEADAYRRIDSVHVPQLYAKGVTPSGAEYMALDLLKGDTLGAWLSRRSMSIAAVLELGQQLAHALGAVHQRAIVHCDVKPRNLILEKDVKRGTILKLIDFGICNVEGSAREPSRHDLVVGTPQYMSPEQILGLTVDARTDVYSASVVLYQALTRRLPFGGNNDHDVMLAALRDPIVPPRLVRDDCPEALDLVILRGLSRDLPERFATATDMAQAFERVARELGFRATARTFDSRPIRVVPVDPTEVTRRAPSVTPVEFEWPEVPLSSSKH
jgi:eukaryotic-like serine/threonine-protein kinase